MQYVNSEGRWYKSVAPCDSHRVSL
jgi:hypothetical protein